MCNIAGYVGTKPAAPILIDMMRKQEGLDAGVYTGIATIHEGKIYCAKVAGPLDVLLKETDASKLPGTIGIIHSRTPGQRDKTKEWSHPFTCEKDGEIKTAFALNGTIGCCKPQRDTYIPFAEELLAEGYELKSAVPADGHYMELSNGTRVHPSDVLTQLISRRILNGMNTVDALEESYCQMPKEIVGLLLSVTEPDAISWGRMNFPMHLGFAEDGAYLATAPQCFPDEVGEPTLLPIMSSGLIYKDRFTCKAFKEHPFTVAPFSARVRAEAYEACCATLREGKKTVPDLGMICEPLFDKADSTQRGAALYGVLYEIHKQGKLKVEVGYKRGVYEDAPAPVYYMTLAE